MAPRRRNIPDGWRDFDPMKEIIEDIKMVPFKVPLPDRIFDADYSLRAQRWTPSDLMNKVPNLGLVIDLTFKQPGYYDPGEFLRKGIRHIKIGCKGHDVPPRDIFLKFCDTVDDFIKANPNRVVGIHCTHGVNRTGYMICRYMMERRGYAAENALEIFANKRGYPIDRDNYIQAIRN